MLKGFKDFLIRGNVIDLAVGLIMGTAFTAVVTALVQSVLMPAISMLIQSANFDEFLVFGQIKVPDRCCQLQPDGSCCVLRSGCAHSEAD